MIYTQTWQGRLLSTNAKEALTPYFPAEVPGNIQYDWAVHEGFADRIMFGTTAQRFETVEDNYWEYRTRLSFSLPDNDRLFFVALGIDYRFDILLDGVLLCSHEGMYTPVELDITDRARPGSELTVLIHPHPKLPGEFATPREMAAQSVKPPSTYGWDWNPRLIISGIWQPAYLETRSRGYIRACEAFPSLNADRTRGELRWESDCDLPVTYSLHDREGNLLYEGSEPFCRVENPRLWWCNGQGEPYLYTWEARSADHVRTGRIGFRTIRLVMNTGAEQEPNGFPKSRYPAPMTIELNGRRIFAKGSNWVNPELFFGRITEETYRGLLIPVKEANMNILRLWGGSGIKKEAFYELCDELGILLFQEFVLACNNYIGSPAYLAVLEQEASAIITQLRHHPSIALWCGGNELFNNWSGMDDQSHALRLLNKLCYDLDFERPYIMTAPIEGMKHGCYVFDDGQQTVYPMFQNAHGTAYSEFGVPGTASADNLRKIIPEEELFPIERTESWVYHHAFGAWGEQRWLCLDLVRKYFGEPACLEDVVNATQWMQCEGYKAIFEEARRQWPYCSMAINWCCNEPWITAANNALFTYPNEKKPAYYAVRDSLRPVLASARLPKFDWKAGQTFTAQLWLLNDSPDEISDTLTASLLLAGEEIPLGSWETGSLSARENRCGPEVSLLLPAADAVEMTLRLTAGDGRSSEYRLRYDRHNLR